MDQAVQQEIRLQQLTQKLLSGEMTDEERQEYDALRNEQSAELSRAVANLTKEQNKPKFLRRKS